MSLGRIAVVIGMPRAGTTWLYENIKHHPDVCVSDYKEINRYLRELSDSQYLDYFRCGHGKVMLDISPLYYFAPSALSRIAQNHQKVILLIRNQQEWITSLQNQIRKYSGKVDEMMATGRYLLPVEGGKPIVFDYGCYRQESYLAHLRQMFGDRLLLLDYAMLESNPLWILGRVEQYLGIRPYFTPENALLGKVNSSEASISPWYLLLQKTGLTRWLIPLALALCPKSFVHWLRKKYIYGG